MNKALVCLNVTIKLEKPAHKAADSEPEIYQKETSQTNQIESRAIASKERIEIHLIIDSLKAQTKGNRFPDNRTPLGELSEVDP